MNNTATFIIYYKPPPASTGGKGYLTLRDPCARDFEGDEENQNEACEAVKRFVNDYFGGDVVEWVDLEED